MKKLINETVIDSLGTVTLTNYRVVDANGRSLVSRVKLFEFITKIEDAKLVRGQVSS